MKDIRAIANRIAEKFDVEKIILFGSYAYGKPGKNSDIDLLVVLESKQRNWKIFWDIYRAITPLPYSIDLVVRTGKEIRERIPQGDWFLRDIVHDGLVLYESGRN